MWLLGILWFMRFYVLYYAWRKSYLWNEELQTLPKTTTGGSCMHNERRKKGGKTNIASSDLLRFWGTHLLFSDASRIMCKIEDCLNYQQLFQTIEKNGVHNVILAVALRSCQKCNHFMPSKRNDLSDLTCSNCSPNGRLFQFSHRNGPSSVIGLFCRWLFSRENQHSVAIAHNAKGWVIRSSLG